MLLVTEMCLLHLSAFCYDMLLPCNVALRDGVLESLLSLLRPPKAVGLCVQLGLYCLLCTAFFDDRSACCGNVASVL